MPPRASFRGRALTESQSPCSDRRVQVSLSVRRSSVQYSFDRAVMYAEGGGDAVQWVVVLVGEQYRLDALDSLTGRLGGHQLGGELRVRA